MLAHWLPLSILVIKGKISRKQFKCSYLKNKKLFNTFLLVLESTSNFQYFEKKDETQSSSISGIWLWSFLLRQCLQHYVLGETSTLNLLTGAKACFKKSHSAFNQLLDVCWAKVSRKTSVLVTPQMSRQWLLTQWNVNTMTANGKYS